MAELMKLGAHRSKTHGTDVLRGLPLNRAATSKDGSRHFPYIFSFDLKPLVQVTGLLNNEARVSTWVCLSWMIT